MIMASVVQHLEEPVELPTDIGNSLLPELGKGTTPSWQADPSQQVVKDL